ncbi:hypothetical protein H072_8051 [Dactylellina haptotyla CBS 200.50]|uniref:ATP-grasp domain-containing protein n=1 Tax=Dactylellina haptotyla (strain CBS 200.50) TaxID=1284197 RepID=S8BFV4_DACHA|nr:hypothetical protein H072_8051 [Dactylellina haptotyla CBS 200.50]
MLRVRSKEDYFAPHRFSASFQQKPQSRKRRFPDWVNQIHFQAPHKNGDANTSHDEGSTQTTVTALSPPTPTGDVVNVSCKRNDESNDTNIPSLSFQEICRIVRMKQDESLEFPRIANLLGREQEEIETAYYEHTDRVFELEEVKKRKGGYQVSWNTVEGGQGQNRHQNQPRQISTVSKPSAILESPANPEHLAHTVTGDNTQIQSTEIVPEGATISGRSSLISGMLKRPKTRDLPTSTISSGSHQSIRNTNKRRKSAAKLAPHFRITKGLSRTPQSKKRESLIPLTQDATGSLGSSSSTGVSAYSAASPVQEGEENGDMEPLTSETELFQNLGRVKEQTSVAISEPLISEVIQQVEDVSMDIDKEPPRFESPIPPSPDSILAQPLDEPPETGLNLDILSPVLSITRSKPDKEKRFFTPRRADTGHLNRLFFAPQPPILFSREQMSRFIDPMLLTRFNPALRGSLNHVAKFSNAVRQSFKVPAPHDDQDGYRKAVSEIIRKHNIHLIIPMHEEIIHLSGSGDPQTFKRLLAPPKRILLRLHNKWEFSQWAERIGLGVPKHYLCETLDDVKSLPALDKIEYALKPVFGRASQSVFHLKPGEELPLDKLDMRKKWIAQEWIYGERYCSYSVIADGNVAAFSLYKVLETIDGSSCVYFKSVEQKAIFDYVSDVATELGLEGVKGTFQLAFDFIEPNPPAETETDKDKNIQLVSIECNPRSTSGIHLFAGMTDLGLALTDGNRPRVVAHSKAKRQVFPGMMMWEHSDASVGQWLRHMKRLMGSKDIVFSAKDLLPTLMQPFLLTSYYEICREKNLKLPDMFQLDVTWEPDDEELKGVYEIAVEDRTSWMKRRNLSEVQIRERRNSIMAGSSGRGLVGIKCWPQRARKSSS